jgi:hypothetical protein
VGSASAQGAASFFANHTLVLSYTPPVMTSPAVDLFAAALALPEEERVTLASELLASIDGPPDPNWEATWFAELERRQDESPTGSDWFDVRARLINKLAGR